MCKSEVRSLNRPVVRQVFAEFQETRRRQFNRLPTFDAITNNVGRQKRQADQGDQLTAAHAKTLRHRREAVIGAGKECRAGRERPLQQCYQVGINFAMLVTLNDQSLAFAGAAQVGRDG